MALYLDVEPGETVLIGGARVAVQKKSGSRVRLRIEADAVVSLQKGDAEPIADTDPVRQDRDGTQQRQRLLRRPVPV